MAKKQFNVVTKATPARPRSNRRTHSKSGGSSAVSVIIQGGGAGSIDPNSHSHSNKALLDSLSSDEFGYLYSKLEKIKAGYADVAGTLAEDSPIFKIFLRKDQPDQTKFLLKLLGGVFFGIYEKGRTGAKIDINGTAEFLSTIIRESVQSIDYKQGPLCTGFVIKTNPKTGRSYAEVDELFVRIKAFFTELEIRKLTFAGGNWIFSPAGATCSRVEEHDTFFRCFFSAENEEKEVKNEFRINDLVRCQEFNVKEGTTHNATNQYYWRLCVGIGNDYIDLSKTKCDPVSMVPKVGDDMVTLGNIKDAERQNAIIISTYGEGSPSITQHTGIGSNKENPYSLLNTEKTRISPQKNIFTGEFLFETGKSVKDSIDQAQKDASNAQIDANTAKGEAEKAQNKLKDWASDKTISPTEKLSLKQEIESLKTEKIEIVNNAMKYVVDTTTYIPAYEAYLSQLQYYTATTPENIEVLPTFAEKQTAYYNARTIILEAIAIAAKGYVDTGVSGAKSYTDTKIKATNESITLAVNNVTIGSVNLAVNTKNISGNPKLINSTNPSDGGFWNSSLFQNLVLGNWYMISFTARAVTVDTNIHVEFNGSKGGDVLIQGTAWKRYGVLSKYYKDPAFYFWLTSTNDGFVEIKDIKIEEGNKPTSWSPAPEDLTDKDSFNKLSDTVSEQSAQIQLNKEGIEARVTKIEYNKLQIGGVNLQSNTDCRDGLFGYVDGGYTAKISETIPSMGGNSPSKSVAIFTHGKETWRDGLNCWKCITKPKMVEGRIYTLSFWLACNLHPANIHFEFDGGNGRFEANNPGGWKFYSNTFVAHGGNMMTAHLWINSIAGEELPDSFWLCGYKLEEGNRATSWCPSATEIDSKLIEHSSKIKENAEAIEMRVTSKEFKDLHVENTNLQKNTDFRFGVMGMGGGSYSVEISSLIPSPMGVL